MYYLCRKKMIHSTAIYCPYCDKNDLVKNGKTGKGIQRWKCNACKKYFQLDYHYNACKQGMKEKIIELTLNSSGVRDIERTLKIHRDTVTNTLKKNAKNEPLLSHYGRKRRLSKIRNRDKMQ